MTYATSTATIVLLLFLGAVQGHRLEDLEQQGRIPAWMGQDTWMRRSSFPSEEDTRLFIPSWTRASTKSGVCTQCYTGVLSPTLTYPDRSDLFKGDFWSPSKFEEVPTNDSITSGCFYDDSTPGCLTCNDTAMDSVPEDLPPVLTVFKMLRTRLDTLKPYSFNGKKYQVMELEENAIMSIKDNAFRGIIGLESLSLDGNNLKSLNWSRFAGLDSLLILSIRSNFISLSEYENVRFGHPSSSNETSFLPNLVYLNLAGNPLNKLFPSFFWSLRDSPIEELNLQSCNLSFIHPDAFLPLTRLVHVDFFNNTELTPYFQQDPFSIRLPETLLQIGLGANGFFKSFPTSIFKNNSVEIINLSRNVLFSLPILPEILSSLKTLILEDCNLSAIKKGTFQYLNNLEQLYLGGNQLSMLAPEAFPPTLTLLSLRQNPQWASSNQPFRIQGNLAAAKNLRWLDMTYLKLEPLSVESFVGLDQLFVLQLRGSGIKDLEGGTFAPLASSLRWLDLGGNIELSELPIGFSQGLEKIAVLFLDHCSLDFPGPLEQHIDNPFSGMRELHLLYIHNNQIHYLDPMLLEDFTTLELLYMSENLLKEWVGGVTRNFPAYETVLIASNNLISILPNETFEEFSRLWHVDLSNNAFVCNCATMDLQRLAGDESNVTVINWNSTEYPNAYLCTDVTSSPNMPTFMRIEDMTEEEFQCDNRGSIATTTSNPNGSDPSDGPSMSSVLGGIAAAIALVGLTAIACYYKRSYIQRAWFLFRHRKDGMDVLKRESTQDFEYDAFISFSEHDRPWVYSHLVPNLEWSKDAGIETTSEHPWFRLCLHDRDFTVGQRITENIIDNIAKSRKVVIVLSKTYVESKWCQFELHLSQHRLLEMGRNDAMILVLLEEVPKKQQEGWLRYLIRTRTYLAWRPDLEGQQLFWRRLRQVLLNTPNNRQQSSREAVVHTT